MGGEILESTSEIKFVAIAKNDLGDGKFLSTAEEREKFPTDNVSVLKKKIRSREECEQNITVKKIFNEIRGQAHNLFSSH